MVDSAAAQRRGQVRLDETSESGVLYLGTAAIDALESSPVWQLSRFKNGALEYCQTLAAWDVHLSVTYGVEG